MNTEEVFRLIHQNGVGQNIRCFLISGDIENDKDYMSKINNYRYKRGTISIYTDRFFLLEHEKNLIKSPECKLLIKEDKGKQVNTLWLFCKFLIVKKQHIHARVFSIKYVDTGKEITKKIPIGG